MSALSQTNIIEVAADVYPELTIHPTTIAYIQHILRPYEDATIAYELGGFNDWINAVLNGPDTTSKEYLDKFLNGTEWDWDIFEDDRRLFESAKQVLLRTLVIEIIIHAGDNAEHLKDTMILPWDVKGAIIDHGVLNIPFSNILGGMNPDELPVKITPSPAHVPITINASDEFVIGLLLFSVESKYNFRIEMFGVPFDTLYLTRGALTRFDYDPNSENRGFALQIGDHMYGFYSLRFVRGFMTGALWAGVDHKKYWDKLYRYEFPPGPTGNNVPVVTELTF